MHTIFVWNFCWDFQHFVRNDTSVHENEQENIPVGCVPSAAVAVSPAMHAPYHAHPLPHMYPLPCMPPSHACPPVMHAPQSCMPPPT